MDKMFPHARSKVGTYQIEEKNRKYTYWMKTFVEDHPYYLSKKEHCSSTRARDVHKAEKLEIWGFFVESSIDYSTQLVGSISC